MKSQVFYVIICIAIQQLHVSTSLQLLPLRHKLQKNLPSSSATKKPTIIAIHIPPDKSEHDAQKIIDEHLMDLALEQAREAGGTYGEVPIGALIAQPVQEEVRKVSTEDGGSIRHISILSNGQNQIETFHDASAHAEMQALRSAAKTVQNWRLLNSTLYTTLEPCPMCLSAAQAFRVSRIVYGAPDLRLGAIETYMNLLDYPHPFHGSDALEVMGGVRGDEAKTLLIDFFRERRKIGKRQKKNSAIEEGETVAEEQLDPNNYPNGTRKPRRLRRLLHIFKRMRS